MPQETILIADDERFVREVCVRATQEDGYRIEAVGSGEEAVRAAQERDFDLFLTDLRMPGMSGLDAFRAIRQIRPEITGVAMTGYATMEAAIEALQLGFHDFLLKPFSPQDVRLAVARALEQRRLRQENARLKALIPVYTMTRALMSITDCGELLDQVIRLATQEMGADMAAILLLDEQGARLTLAAASGLGDVAQAAQAVAGAEGSLREAMRDAQPRIWTREQGFHLPFGEHLGALTSVPLVAQGQPLGLMVVGRRPGAGPNGGSFTYSDVELLSVLGGQAAVAIKNAQLFAEVQLAYRKVEESDHLKSEFIAIASHELRTPLVSILGYVELLTYDAQGEAREQLETVLQQALRLRDVVNDMLSLTDLRSGSSVLTWDQVSVGDIVRRASRDLAAEVEAKSLRLVTDIPEDCQIIRADHERLQLALAKLISNAVKFSPLQGRVLVRVARGEQAVRFTVSDQGPGIPKEAQEKLFRPFYQVEESLRRSHSGMGLGLSIAKGLVQLHGGDIHVESEPGEGTTFVFSIPQPDRPANGA
ncbi:MAG: response regulator [Chloroflexi bacterium]|nr:response regulator [Chloroflexota bacterium]